MSLALNSVVPINVAPVSGPLPLADRVANPGLVTAFAPLFADASCNVAETSFFVCDLSDSFKKLGVHGRQDILTADYTRVFSGLSEWSQQKFIAVIANNYFLSQESVRLAYRRECVLLTAAQRKDLIALQKKCEADVAAALAQAGSSKIKNLFAKPYIDICEKQTREAKRKLSADNAIREAASLMLGRVFTKPATLKDANNYRIPGLAPVSAPSCNF